MRAYGSSIAAAFAAALALVPTAGAQQIGTTGAVNPAAQSQPPGGSLRTMNVGANVVFRERINTSENGSVQLVFVDRTTLSIGPNSQLTIDEFVYDPKTDTGRMTASLTRGVMRFVGGQVSHTGGATIKTPATTLGVRGGVVTVRHDAQNGTRAINHFGTVTAQTPNGVEVIRRPGFALSVANTNTAPSAPRRATQSEIDGNNRQLTSAQGQTGGRREVPTDEGASRAVGQTNSQVGTTVVEGQKQTTTQTVTATKQQAVEENLVVTTATQTIVQQGGQLAAATTIVAPPVNIKPVPPRRVYAMQGASVVGNLMPSAFLAPGPTVESPIYGYGVGGTTPTGAHQTGSRILMAGMVINGAGAAQSSSIYGMWAGVYDNFGEFVVDGGIRGTTRLNAGASMGRLAASIASTPGSVTLDGDYSPLSATVNQNSFNSAGARTTETGFYYPGTGGNANYTYTAQAARIPTPPTLGVTRPTVELYGYAAGLMRTSSDTLNINNGPSFPVWGDTYISLTEAGRFWAAIDTFRGGGFAGPADNFNYATNYFGFIGDGTGARSTYVDYNNFLAAESADRATGQRLSEVNGVQVLNQHALMVTNQTVGAASFFPGVNFCNCEYSRWGFWSTDTQRSGLTAASAPDTVRDRLHMGTWVAGVPTSPIDVPTTGSATYTGHIIGSFKTGGNEYIAAGNFSNTVNFGANTGNVSVTGLDGRNYGGTVAINIMDRTSFNGSIPSTSGPAATMGLGGTFMQGRTGPAGEMIGSFQTNGTGYVGSGTFAATR